MFGISDLRREILHLRSVCLRPPPRILLYFHAYVGSGYFLGFKFFAPSPPPDTLIFIFSCIRRLGYFLGFKFLNFNIFFFWGGGGGGGVQKTAYFWEYEDFVEIFCGHHKIGLYDAF